MVTLSTVQEGKYLEVNDSFCRTTGYTREEVIGQTENDIGYWVKPSVREQMVRALLKKGALHDIEALFRAKDGKMIVGSVSADLIELDNQSYVLSIIIDVTKRKQAETDRTLMTKAIEQAAESIFITDPRGIIQYANPATEAVSGYTRAEILGENISFLRSPQNEKNMMETMRQNLSQGKAWKGHLINKKKDDSRYEVETTISPVKGQAGRITSFVAVERDVTSMARLEKQLRQAQKMEAIGTLAGGIAHDFNNILMAMMGYAQLAKDQLPEGSPLGSDLKEVVTAGERARDLINQILTFSRQVEQEYRPLDVRLIFKEAVKLLRASIPATVEIKIEADKEVGHVLADTTQMHQVIMNLCTNAHQAMQGQHGTLTVSVKEEELTNDETETLPTNIEPGKYVRLTVADTGRGMTADVVERIFDPYFTTKELGEGTGMGLAIVHGIVTSHGGGITVQSEPGKGTAVNVYLPVCPTPTGSEVAKETGVIKGTERILFVDDELQIATLGKRILESLGYTVTLFTDSEEALNAFRENSTNYDLVITDLTMPKLTGEELTKELLAIRDDVPVILCTGFGETLTLDRVRELGVRDFLIKPVVPGVMSKAVRQALGQISE
jgi:PAS domain S-box-containing protein